MAYTEKKILNWKENNKVEEIEKILSDINSLYNERIFAISTLTEINNASSIEPLKKVIENDSVKIVVEAAIKAIEIIGLTPEISTLIDKRMQEFKIKEEKSAQIKDKFKNKTAKRTRHEIISDVTIYKDEKLLLVIENPKKYNSKIIENANAEIEQRGGIKQLEENRRKQKEENHLRLVKLEEIKKQKWRKGIKFFILGLIPTILLLIRSVVDISKIGTIDYGNSFVTSDIFGFMYVNAYETVLNPVGLIINIVLLLNFLVVTFFGLKFMVEDVEQPVNPEATRQRKYKKGIIFSIPSLLISIAIMFGILRSLSKVGEIIDEQIYTVNSTSLSIAALIFTISFILFLYGIKLITENKKYINTVESRKKRKLIGKILLIPSAIISVSIIVRMIMNLNNAGSNEIVINPIALAFLVICFIFVFQGAKLITQEITDPNKSKNIAL